MKDFLTPEHAEALIKCVGIICAVLLAVLHRLDRRAAAKRKRPAPKVTQSTLPLVLLLGLLLCGCSTRSERAFVQANAMSTNRLALDIATPFGTLHYTRNAPEK